MSSLLVDVLAKVPAANLESFVGRPTTTLLQRLDSPARSPQGFAELIVNQMGAAAVLRTDELRRLVLASLAPEEAARLCKLLDLPQADPVNTLCSVPFSRSEEQLELLFRNFGVSYEPEDDRDEEGTRRSSPRQKLYRHQEVAFRELRSQAGNGATGVLLHMPAGAGKLRIAATTLIDLYRSQPENSITLWLSHETALCRQAFEELERVWRALGSRDTTFYRIYGTYRPPALDSIQDGIVVADIRRLLDQDIGGPVAARDFGKRTRAIVLHETMQADTVVYRAAFDALQVSSSCSLIGLSAASGRLLHATGKTASLRTLFPGKTVSLPGPDPLGYLRAEGFVGQLTFETEPGRSASDLTLEVGELDISAEARATLTTDVERNVAILRRVVSEVEGGGNVILHAASAEQARMFKGVLGLKGTQAIVVTSEMPPARQIKAVQQFQSGDRTKVLCVYGLFISRQEAAKANVVVIARPTTSPILFSQMVGRLAETRIGDDKPTLKVVTFVDAVPGFRDVAEAFESWSNIEQEGAES